MPFYEYQCKSCGHALEAMQKISESPLRKCPQCGKSQLTRLMSAPVFRLKGGGWYETDFKGDQDHKKNLADAPGASKDDKTAASDVKAAEAPAKDGAKTPDKPAEKSADKASDKPKEKSATETAAKPAAPAISRRGVSAAPAKSKPRSTAKRPALKAKKARR